MHTLMRVFLEDQARQTTDGPRYRSIHMSHLSACVFSVLSLCCAILHTAVPHLSKYLSTLMVGGLFTLVIVPVIFVWIVTIIIAEIFPSFPSSYFLYAFCGMYIINILIIDTSHLKPPLLNQFKMPSSWMEERALDFWLQHFKYFPMTIEVADEKKVKLPIDKQYIFAVHPHGIHCWPLNCLSLPKSPFDLKFPGLVGSRLTGLAATIVFKIPVVREIFLSMGYIDASKKNAVNALELGRSLFICTGGEDEAMRSKQGEDTVVLLNRKGFVKLALSYGCSLVPVFGVGVSELYSTYDLGTLSFRKYLQKAFGIALPLFHGVWGTPLPYKEPIKVLIGEPIHTPPVEMKGGDVDAKLLDEYHNKYLEAVKKLYDDHMKKNGNVDRKLIIV